MKKTSSSNRGVPAVGRLDWIDNARGIGIILVVYGHMILGLYGANLYQLNHQLFIQYLVIYSFHMPLFFFLSGLLARNWSKKPAKPAIFAKANGLLRPYLIWGVIQGLVMIALSSYTQNQISFSDILLLPFKPNSQFWFVYVLFFIFVAYYTLAKLRYESLTGAVVLLLFLASPLLKDIWILEQLTFNLAFFMAGVYLSRYKELAIKKSVAIPLLVLSFVLFALVNYLLYKAVIPLPLKTIFQFVAAMSGIGLCVGLTQLNIGVLTTIGKYTMPIYLLHTFFTSGVRIGTAKLGINENIAIVLLLGTVLGVVLPIVIYLILQKLRLSKIFF